MALDPNALTTLATVKSELSITGSGEDATLERFINSISTQIEKYCAQEFFFETGKVERVPGFGDVRLIVSKTPIITITKIAFIDVFSGDESIIAANDFEVENALAGFIRRQSGWVWTVPHRQEITTTAIPGGERKAFEVTYDAGFVTPEQGGSVTLPKDLEDAAIRAIVARFLSKARDTSVTSEKLMSWSASYGSSRTLTAGGGMWSPDVREVLDRYRRVEQA